MHIFSDYVFDGTREPHFESEDLSPLSVYGASKAAGDLLVEQLDKFYLLRTTWVIGEGKNFVRTMLGLAEKNISPTVVNDQVGRLTFTSELVRIIDHLLSIEAPFGTYNATNDGPLESWADITKRICSDHLRSAGPRWSDRRSRGRNARPGVRNATAPDATVREITLGRQR